MTEIPKYSTSIPSLMRTMDDEFSRDLNAVNKIKEEDAVDSDYVNIQEEINIPLVNYVSDPVTFSKSPVDQAQTPSSSIDNLNEEVLSAPPEASLEGIAEQITAMRAEIQADLDALRAELGNIRANFKVFQAIVASQRKELHDGH